MALLRAAGRIRGAGCVALVVLGPLAACAQGKIVVGNADKNGAPCRLRQDQIVPLVQRTNPYFDKHRWDDANKTETAEMGPDRRLTIVQTGCLRHHIKLEYVVGPSLAQKDNLGFYATEVFNLFNRLYSTDPDWWALKPAFEQRMVERLPAAGLGQVFDFQINEHTFICEMGWEAELGSVIKVEHVRLLHEYKMKQAGVPRYLDDAWFQAPKPQPAPAP